MIISKEESGLLGRIVWRDDPIYLNINGRLELLNVLVERLCLPPASPCQVGILIDNTNVMEALSMPDKVHNLYTKHVVSEGFVFCLSSIPHVLRGGR